MFQAELHIRQEKQCVLSEFARVYDIDFGIEIEELHDGRVTFVIDLADPRPEFIDFFHDSEQVSHIEQLDDHHYLITKQSCGAYSAIDCNHGILRRQTKITTTERIYTVLLFRREDLKAVIDEFRNIGAVTLENITDSAGSDSRLTVRQREVIQHALDAGYFDWPRKTKSEELAEQLGISRATFLEHLRKAESKLLTDALADSPNSNGRSSEQHSQPTPTSNLG